MQHELAPELRERFEILGELGSGAFGRVLRVRDRATRAARALKLIPVGPDRRRIERELQLARELVHEHVLTCFEAGIVDDQAYLVLELAEGNLELLLDRPEDRDRAWRALRQAALGVAYLHSRGFVHRDLKPENILLVAGLARVADLGLARGEGHATVTRTGAILGSPATMAPEQARGERVTAAADAFALGVIAYRIVEGALPYPPELPLGELLERVARAQLDSLHRSRGWLPEAARTAMLAALDPDPARRPTDLAAWSEELGSLDPCSEDAITLASTHRIPSSAPPSLPAGEPGRGAAPQVAPLPPSPAPTRPRSLASLGWLLPVGLALALALRPGGAPPAPGPPAPPVAAPDPEPELEPIGLNASGYREVRNLRDGSVLIEVPGGPFTSHASTERGQRGPPQTMALRGFLIGKTEVTVGQFRRFIEATHRSAERADYLVHADDDRPMVFVSWSAAREYCRWAGGRLPGAVEWERAAAGLDERSFPWGDAPPGATLANFGQREALASLSNPEPFLRPVGSYPAGASPVGALDMAGNVSEWVDEERRDPALPSLTSQVILGGSYMAQASSLHTWFVRASPADHMNPAIGLRLARDLQSRPAASAAE